MIFLFLLVAVFSAQPSRIWAQASVNVSTNDPVYRDIDKLVAHGLVDKIIVGQRPYSRIEVARIVKEAMVHLPRLQDALNDSNTPVERKEKLQARLDYLAPIFERLKRQYREELVQLGALVGEKSWYSFHPIEKVEAEAVIADSPAEALPVSNGLGEINAVINPLLDYKQGRHLIDGGNLALETTTWLRATNYFAMQVKPRFQLGIGRNGTPDANRVDILNLYGKFWVKNFEVEVGRDNLFWGQGAFAGQMFSANPRGFDMIKISNDSPSFLPWVFKYLGANKISFFYADLGPEQNFPHSYLVGYKWSLQPLSFFEIGVGLATQSGGDGSPPASFGGRVRDVLPFDQATGATQVQIGNHIGELDFRFRIPPARHLEIYVEGNFDDNHSPFKNAHQAFIDDAGWVAGFYLPRLTDSGNVDLRMEFHFTGLRFYEHAQFTSGWTLNRFIMGDNLGPNALGLYGMVNWDIDTRNLLGFDVAFESRSSDQWTVLDPEGEFIFQKVSDGPEERRFRGGAEWLHRMDGLPLQLRARLAYERVQNFNFISDNDRNNFLGEVGVRIDLDRWTKFPR
ncbi:MAG: capsule assembly Wzi family protein [Deltaproteobacteria bacterium]|nr:capsule assembly Wzi family protein [Deltaproteobacteria bacterium]